MTSRTGKIGKAFRRIFLKSKGEHLMSEENAPEAQEQPEAQEEENTMPSASKQIMVMGIIVVGITIVLGGGVFLSMYLK